MKVGLVARSEDRGLGILTWEFFRHVEPDRTLVIDVGDLARGFPAHGVRRYPGASLVRWDGGELPEAPVRRWLAGLDVVYLAETPYDYRFFDWCRAAGVRSVLHAMPEFARWERERDLPRPDVTWLPTSWRADHLPGARVVPVPVALDRFVGTGNGRRIGHSGGGPLTFLHVVGHRAAGDRAGTSTVLTALRSVRAPCRVRLITQDGRLPSLRGRSGIDVEVVLGGVDDYWRLYDDADVLVAPRRYGGLSLPLNEAAAAGMALVMPDSPPHPTTWPGLYVPAIRSGMIAAPGGTIHTWVTNAPALGAVMTRLVHEPETVADASCASIAWAQAHSWATLGPLVLAELYAACT